MSNISKVLFCSLIAVGIAGCDHAPERSKYGIPSGGTQVQLPSTAGDSSVQDGALKSSAGLVGATPLRRLTNNDYTNSVTDLVGDISSLNIQLLKESSSLIYPFTNHATEQYVPTALANQYFVAAEMIAAATFKDKTRSNKILTCTPLKGTEETCAAIVLKALATKAFRRLATAEQVSGLLEIWRAGFKAVDFNTGVEWALAAVLQAPEFLYRIEMGTAPAAPGVVALDSWDMANRLSYLIWNSAPDQMLMDAAKNDKLKTVADVSAQVDRMLVMPGAHDMVIHFHDQWLGLETIDTVQKDPKSFPNFNKTIALAMRDEVRNFVEDAVWNGDSKLQTLLSGQYTYLNKTLGDYYGIKGLGATFTKMSENKLGGRPASGILTMAGMLAVRSNANDTSPTRRGAFVRSALFCQTMPNPPDNAIFTSPVSKPNMTRRDLIEAHATNAACAACHNLMDPIGLAFENIDAAGVYRDKESGKTIDASAELFATDVDGKFSGPSELANKMSVSKKVADCVATHWFQFAYGRDPIASDAPVVKELGTRLTTTGIISAIKYLTQTPQFFYRTVAEGAK
ncbi:MAG: DUF1592 domain-containing protein [Chitinophagaceae bacterium]|nr:DUF1592 domain-containing protein [Oligoflexus sp.]